MSIPIQPTKCTNEYKYYSGRTHLISAGLTPRASRAMALGLIQNVENLIILGAHIFLITLYNIG